MKKSTYSGNALVECRFHRVLCGMMVWRERSGAALIVALILLLLFALVGSTIMVLSVNDDRMISDRMSNIGALAAAEAGIAEAIRRLSLPKEDTLSIGDDDIPLSAGWETYILLAEELPPDHAPVYYRKSIQMQLPESLRIVYSTSMIGEGYALKISHKRDPEGKERVVFYNWDEGIEEVHDPLTYKGKYLPIEIIEATGVSGAVRRTLQVEVAKQGFVADIPAALSSKVAIEVNGRLSCCGHNHSFATPWETNAGKDRYECFDEPEADDAVWHEQRSDGKAHAHAPLFTSEVLDRFCSGAGCVPGISAPGCEIRMGKYCVVRGNPDWTADTTVTAFHCLYEMLNTSSWDELEKQFPWQAVEPGTIHGGNFVGYYRCEGDLELEGVINFTGVLWVTGNLKQRGHLSMNGIIYTEGSFACHGNMWMLGAVALEGKGQRFVRPFSGKAVVLYSLEGIERALAAAEGYRIISRREK